MSLNANNKIKKLAQDNNGELPAYTWPGAYPLFYVDNQNNVLCPDCANKNDTSFDPMLVDYDINWEDTSLYCDQCSKQIESAYEDDDNQEG